MSTGNELPRRVVKLASEMFGGNTGMSGPELYDFFADYTDDLGEYPWGGGAPSRWQIVEIALGMLTLELQQSALRCLCSYEDRMKYGPPPPKDVERLLAMLDGVGSPGATSAAAALEELDDWEAVQRSWSEALSKVATDAEGAIRAARSTFESVCKHICDERGQAYERGWDLSRLYKATARSLDIAPDQHSEQIIKQILSGVATTVEGLAGLRNALSDAHGKGKSAVRPAPRHAKLAVNAGFAVAGFLIDTHVEKKR